MSPGRSLSPFAAALVLAGVAVTWGAIPLFVRSDVSAAGLVGVRVTFGAVALVVVAAFLRRLRFPAVQRWRVLVSGVLLTAHWLTFFVAIKSTTVAVALAVMYLGPIAAAVLSGPILGERVPPRVWLALSVAAVGTLVVVQPWAIGSSGEGAAVTGVLAAFASGALLAALMIVAKPAAQALGGLTMSIGELTIATVILAPATVDAVTSHPDQIASFLVLGAVFTGLANFVYWEVYRVLPVATVSTIVYLEPASAVLWALAFLGEKPDLLTWIGVGLVVVGGAMAATVARTEEEIVVPVHP